MSFTLTSPLSMPSTKPMRLFLSAVSLAVNSYSYSLNSSPGLKFFVQADLVPIVFVDLAHQQHVDLVGRLHLELDDVVLVVLQIELGLIGLHVPIGAGRLRWS